MPNFQAVADRVIQIAAEQVKLHDQKSTAGWKACTASALTAGAGDAHRFLRPKQLQEVLARTSHGQLYQYAGDCQAEWAHVWSTHAGTAITRRDADVWEQLPPITLQGLKKAIGSFPWMTGIGQVAISPRLFQQCSDAGLEVLGQLLMRCEALLMWPDPRLLTTLV